MDNTAGAFIVAGMSVWVSALIGTPAEFAIGAALISGGVFKAWQDTAQGKRV